MLFWLGMYALIVCYLQGQRLYVYYMYAPPCSKAQQMAAPVATANACQVEDAPDGSHLLGSYRLAVFHRLIASSYYLIAGTEAR